jgi:hypothetical protein
MLSILGPISSHSEHARKCLKLEYLSRIEYDFQKSRVTGPWDHKDSVSAQKVLKKFHACVPLKTIEGGGRGIARMRRSKRVLAQLWRTCILR